MSFQIRADGIMDPEGRYPNPLTGQPYSKAYRYMAMEKRKEDGRQDGWVQFDTWRDRIDIIKKIHKSNILLVKIPPGTGKTVIIPKLLLHYFGYQKPIICTGPKQVTVEKAAEFAAKCLDVPYYAMDDKGDEMKNPDREHGDNRYPTGLRLVGYKHGNEKRMSNASTKLLFTTDGWIKENIIRDDANLSKYGGVIVDEVHERSVNIDIVIALLMDIIKRRPDFKVIFVSATMDLNLFEDYMKRINLGSAYSIYTLPDSKAPYKRTLVKDSNRVDSMQLVDVVYKKINEIILNPQLPVGNILAFVTSDPETGKIKKKIEKNMKNYPINNKPYPIAFSRITPQKEQKLATDKNSLQTIKPTPDAPQGFARKVVIGTNVVESSVTFDDPLVYVIETGLSFEKIYNATHYCFNTGKFEIARSSIEQRCGRTGRTSDGTCYQLYRQSDFDNFKEFTPPKILQEDLTGDFLNIIIMPMNGNLQKGLAFLSRMIEPPKNYQPAIYRAYNNLLNMDMIDSAGNITMLGRICNSFNKFDLKIAKMVVGSFYLQCHNLAIPLGAILQTVLGFDDIFFKPPGMDTDFALERQYEANIKRLKDDRGDHMTLLRIYYFWVNSPDPNTFAEENGLELRTLRKIQLAEKDLMKEAEKIVPYLDNLKLFNMPNLIPGVQAGGYESYTKLDNFQPYRFDGQVDYEESYDDDNDALRGGGESSSSSDVSNDETDIQSMSRMPHYEEIDNIIHTMHGGLGNADDGNGKITTSLLNNLASRRDAVNSKAIIQNYNTNAKLFDISSSYGGGRSNDDSRASRDDSSNPVQKNKLQTYKNARTRNRRTKKHTNHLISNLAFERHLSTQYGGDKPPGTKPDTKPGAKPDTKPGAKPDTKPGAKPDTKPGTKPGAKPDTKPGIKPGAKPYKKDDKKATPDDIEVRKRLERNNKIMEVITLKGLPQKTLEIPADNINRLYAALFYGYSNNIASYTGSGKKYNVKFSPEKGSINKTVFDYNTTNPTPEWVIYHEFSITKSQGRPDDARMSIVSELKQQDFLTFLDINDIRKLL